MKQLKNKSLNDIAELARDIGKKLKGGETLALVGDLGSGKTSFTQKLGKQLKIRNKITSPTFSLMNIYKARLNSPKKDLWFYHLDLYRTKNFREVKALGIEEIWGRRDAVVVIEWADKIKKHLPKNAWVIKFKHEKK